MEISAVVKCFIPKGWWWLSLSFVVGFWAFTLSPKGWDSIVAKW
jgi:hypothetical protein